MSSTRNFRWFPLAAFIGCALMLGIAATSALAAESPWGELRRFGPTGKAAPTITSTTNAFGVDAKTGDVFIGDEPSGEGKYRLQELDSKGNQLSSVTLTPKTQLAAEKPEKLRGSPAGIEGVAVDSARERVYVLVVYERAEVTEAQETRGEELIDEDEDDAGILYAFSTKGGKLEPVAGTTEGVLANADTLKAQGEAFGEALLEPAGLSVDPTEGDVVLLGQVEEAGETRHLAAQRISDAGVPDARYVAPVEVDEEEAGGGTNSEESTSPVVSASGQVYVEQSNKIVQLPAGFESTNAPTPVFALTGSEALLELGTARAEASFGGGMSIAPEAAGGGRLFTTALIREPAPHGEVGGTYYLGALSLHYSDSAPNGSATELGWTGGSNASIGPQCVLSVEGPRPEVAAGPEGHILVFDPHARQVVEFGPKGSGCPTAHASAVTTTVAGAPLQEVGGVASVPAGTTVTLSATVPQANVLGVQWVYEEGQPAQAGTPHGPIAEGSHAFAKTGETTIKGTIETDDLATPTITVEKKIKVTQAPPTASFTTTSAGPGEAVEFNAGSTSDPNHASIAKYAWKFGDGHEETTTGPIAHHSYAAVGTYTATLTVTDSLGLEGSTTRSVVVATKTTDGGGGGGTGGGSAPSAPAAPKAAAPTPPPPAAGVGGVLSYRASLASTSLAVSSSGALVVKVDCLGQSSCAGTVTLRTLTAVAVNARAAKSKKAILTLASGSFTLAGGHAKAVTLHLSAKARKLLAHSHVLRARATILARDAKGVTHTTAIVVTLRPAKARHH